MGSCIICILMCNTSTLGHCITPQPISQDNHTNAYRKKHQTILWGGKGCSYPSSSTKILSLHRRRGDGRPGHLWHYAVHLKSHLYLVCWPSSQHGQLAFGSRNSRHEAFTSQCPCHDSPAFRGRQGNVRSIEQVQVARDGKKSWDCFSEYVQGQATDIAIQAEEILKLKRQINTIYAKHTGQPLETIGGFFCRFWL